MNRNYALKILGILELNTAYYENKRVTVFHINQLNYGLLVYTLKEFHITFLKLSLKERIFHDDNLELNPKEETYSISLLNVFSLPFALLNIICTSNNIWTIGQQFVLDLKPVIEAVLEKVFLEENAEYMEIDVEEFHHETFHIPINTHHHQKYDLHLNDIFIGYDSMKHGFIQCHKNSNLNTWQLKLILVNEAKAMPSDSTALTFLDFPVSSNKRNVTINSFQGRGDTYDPVVLFINYNYPGSHAFQDIFGVNFSSSNVLCLVGHPDGKLLWSLCDCNNQYHSADKFQTLYDVKQPIIGIYFVDNVKEFEGYGCILVVGVLGQITLFSPKKHPSLTLVPGQNPFWVITAYLKSSITGCIIARDCLLYISNETLCITNLSALLNAKDKNEESCLASNSSELCSIEKMVTVSKSQGVILLLTSSGNIYLTVCKKTLYSETVTSSLPSLMNNYLQQSTVMQKLLNKKFLQSRLFATVSAFASLKFCSNTLKEPITFSISEINLEPRKYLLVINFKSFETLHLDSELCHITATVFTYFEKNFSLVTKTAPYIADQPTLSIELTDTVLQPPFVSVFPLFVEVGLILQLPDEWELIDCFKSIGNCFPFYLRVQTFMVHELHLFQNNALCFPQAFKYQKPKAMKIIEEIALKRPISNILQMKSGKEYHLPTKFNFYLSVSSVKEMMKNSNDDDGDPCEYIKNILLRNQQTNILSEADTKQNPISVEITNKNDKLVISLTSYSFDSLVGLRIAVMDILNSVRNQSKHLITSSTFVNIPASIYTKCENISTSLLSLYGKDVESDEVTETIMQLYQELRRDVSAKLPIL